MILTISIVIGVVVQQTCVVSFQNPILCESDIRNWFKANSFLKEPTTINVGDKGFVVNEDGQIIVGTVTEENSWCMKEDGSCLYSSHKLFESSDVKKFEDRVEKREDVVVNDLTLLIGEFCKACGDNTLTNMYDDLWHGDGCAISEIVDSPTYLQAVIPNPL